MDKGSVSNLISAAALIVAWLLPDIVLGSSVPRDLLLSASLFAFSGGVTNALAVKMLFDRIPGLIGSGVIESRFEEIRVEIKNLIIEQFFSEEHLRRFLERNGGSIDFMHYVDMTGGAEGESPVVQFIEENWDRFASKEAVAPIVSDQVDKLLKSPVGGFLSMVGRDTVENLVGGFVESFAGEMKGKVLEAGQSFEFDASTIDVKLNRERVVTDLRGKVDVLLEEKLEELTPRQVKEMMEDVMRKHLGWLVVWGNVFGALMGLAAYFVQS